MSIFKWLANFDSASLRLCFAGQGTLGLGSKAPCGEILKGAPFRRGFFGTINTNEEAFCFASIQGSSRLYRRATDCTNG
jgi:hypothetical protein